ncbi:MAG: hypothetical protein R2911_36005 [Caldilineaceae bacterium]
MISIRIEKRKQPVQKTAPVALQSYGGKMFRLVGCASEVDRVKREAFDHNRVDHDSIRIITGHDGIIRRRRNLFAWKSLDKVTSKARKGTVEDPDS